MADLDQGAGLLYVPSLALVGLSFSSKRALAQGIVTSGIAVGELIPTHEMLDAYSKKVELHIS